MDKWQEEMLFVSMYAKETQAVFDAVRLAAQALEFDYFSYGVRFPVSYTKPQTVVLSNYPEEWSKHYLENNYQDNDPVVLHGVRSQQPLVWSEQVFASAEQFWEEAQSYGLSFGWSQSSFDAMGIGGLLSLSRSSDKLTAKELEYKERSMSWLVHVAHLSFCRTLNPRAFFQLSSPLSRRETEVLKWSADGKSSQEIAEILNVSKSTIDFHIKNAILKLKTNNKTAAVVRAAMLGLLYAY